MTQKFICPNCGAQIETSGDQETVTCSFCNSQVHPPQEILQEIKTRKLTAAEEILEKSGKPMHYKEITRLLLGRCNLTGNTPHETVRSLIGTNTMFIRTAEGTYALSRWKQYSIARYAKDIAFDVLKAKGKPISLFDLGNEIFKERKFIGSPKQVARNVTRLDKRFYFEESSDLIYLAEWKLGLKSQ